MKHDNNKNFTWKLKVIILTPLWLLSTSPTRKSWSEFKSGLITRNFNRSNEQKIKTKNEGIFNN